MKNFDTWNNLKKSIANSEPIKTSELYINTRDVWWCALGVNIGSEQNGVGQNFERPVLVIKKLSSTTYVVLPLSTKKKLELFQCEVYVGEKTGYVLLDQVKVIDIKRFLKKITNLNQDIFDKIVIRFKNMF